MPRRLQVRKMSDDERRVVEGMARSRTAAVRQVERARIIHASAEGKPVAEIARELRLRADQVRKWIKRFNDRGVAGLEDERRSGRPATYTPEEVSEVIATALTDPDYRSAVGRWIAWKCISMRRKTLASSSRIDDLLVREGLRWRGQET